jgi:O-antigen ligase
MADAVHPGRRALDDWRASHARVRAAGTARTDGWIAGWTGALLIGLLLYVMIGHNPYSHDLTFDPLTGGALMSPVNRYIWLGLLAAAAPILVARRAALAAVAARLWPVLLLFGWFAVTTSWAIDPAASQRRFFLTLLGLIICIAIRVGLPDARSRNATIAWACAIMVLIDLVSWVVAPAASMTDLGLAAIHNHKNTLGAVMLFAFLVLGPYAAGQTTSGKRLFWWGMLAGCIALMVASKSKTSIALTVVAGLAIPVVLAMAGLRARLLWSLAIGLLATLVAAGFGWLAWCGLNGLDPLWPIEQLNFTHRTDVWSFLITEIEKRPWKGVGFGSFWDVDPAVQPSLKTDEWFAKPDAPTNEAHNGYLDLIATTGAAGLIGGLVLLFRWIWGGLTLIRDARFDRGAVLLPFAVFLGLFPVIFFIHNWMESSYFTADSPYGLIILLVGVDIDMRRRGASFDTAARAAYSG